MESIYLLCCVGVWSDERRDLELQLLDYGLSCDSVGGGGILCNVRSVWLVYDGDVDEGFNLFDFCIFSPITDIFGDIGEIRRYLQQGDTDLYYLRSGGNFEENYEYGVVVDLIKFVFLLRCGRVRMGLLQVFGEDDGKWIPCCVREEGYGGVQRTRIYDVSVDFVMGYEYITFVEWHAGVSDVVCDFILDFMRRV